MTIIRTLIVAAITLATVLFTNVAGAQSNQPPKTAPHNGGAGLPPAIQTLIAGFDTTRDAYLKSQVALLGQLKTATTDAERQQVRTSLQGNREQFMLQLKTYRAELRDDLEALKGRISHQEFQRIIDAAYDFGNKEGTGHHRGH